MKILVTGASGATGKLLVEQLLQLGQNVSVIVRSKHSIPSHWINSSNITVIEKNISDISLVEMSEYLSGCEVVVSCLGHNLSLKGIWGKPRRLVVDSVIKIYNTVQNRTSEKPIRLILMNTAGNYNRDFDEPISIAQKFVLALLRLLLPPHSDNEMASEYLRVEVGEHNEKLEWVAVRPDSLTNEESKTDYSLHVSPTRSAIFNPGKTSRINVSDFMTRLILDISTWNNWKGKMPVIYNVDSMKLNYWYVDSKFGGEIVEL